MSIAPKRERQHAEHEADDEAAEKDGRPVHFCSSGTSVCDSRSIRPGHRDHFAEQDEAAPRLGVRARARSSAAPSGGIVREARRAVAEPAIERGFDRRHVGRELGVESRRVADEIPGMDLEELGEQLPRFLREVPPRALFDERQVGLADGLAELGPDGADELGLGELAAEAAKVPFEMTQLPKLLPERHCNL